MLRAPAKGEDCDEAATIRSTDRGSTPAGAIHVSTVLDHAGHDSTRSPKVAVPGTGPKFVPDTMIWVPGGGWGGRVEGTRVCTWGAAYIHRACE